MYLCQTLWDYSKCHHLTDVNIGCLDGVISAHKAVMANACPNLFTAFPILQDQETVTMMLPQSSLLDVMEALQRLYIEGRGEPFEDILGISREKLSSSLKEEVPEDELKDCDWLLEDESYDDSNDCNEMSEDDNQLNQNSIGEYFNSSPVKNKQKENKKERRELSYYMKKKLEKESFHPGDFWCEYCNSNLSSSMDLNKHLIVIPCCFCGYESVCINKYREHLRELHPLPQKDSDGVRSVKCPICPYVNVRSNVANHYEMTHGERVYNCWFEDCDKNYQTRKFLLEHVDQQHVEEGEKRERFQNVQCEICNKMLINKLCYTKHKEAQHGSQEAVSCSWCGKQFKTKAYLDIHEKKIHMGQDNTKKTCELCGLIVSKMSEHMLRKHPENVDPNKVVNYQCPNCEYHTRIKSTLRQHIFNMHTERSLSCEQCGYKSALKSQLNQHKRKVHGVANLPCKYEGCTRMFVQDCDVNDHMKRTHPTGLFNCHQCGKQFLNEEKLKRHIKMHNIDTEGLPCSMCPQRFITKQKLREHINTHTGETPYRCPGIGCDKAFMSSSALSHHKKGCSTMMAGNRTLQPLMIGERTLHAAESNLMTEGGGIHGMETTLMAAETVLQGAQRQLQLLV